MTSPGLVAVGGVVVLTVLLAPLSGWMQRRVSDDDGRVTALLAFVAGLAWLATLPAARRSSTTSVSAGVIVGSLVLAVGALLGLGVVHAGGVAVLAAVFAVVARRAASGQTLGALVLIGLALPTRGDLDTFIGFPLRVLAADGAALLVSPLLGTVGGETVLLLEGRVADVEAACSGLSTLWVAVAAALVLVRLLRSRPTSMGATVVVVTTTIVSLVLMTTVRVAVLTLIALTPMALDDATRATLGAVVHLPLGIIALVVAVGAGVVVGLRCTPPATAAPAESAAGHDHRLGPTMAAMLAVGGFALVSGRTTSAASSAAASASTPAIPVGVWQTQLAAIVPGRLEPLSAAEAALYARHADVAIKWRADDERLGSVLVVVARGTAAHHAPERCLASAGHRIVARFDIVDVVDDSAGAARVLLLDEGRAVAVSFFASPALPASSTIAGLGERYWLDLSARSRGRPVPPVAFVSAIWPRDDGPHPANDLDDAERQRLALLRRALVRVFTQEPR